MRAAGQSPASDGYLNASSASDVFRVQLFKGYGVFADDITTGTFTLSGDDLDFSTCGLCVRLLSAANTDAWTADQYYMATGGTVTLSSVSGHLTGTLTNVTFAHVNLNSSTPIGDGCNS